MIWVLLAASVQAQEVPEGLAGARVMTGAGVVVAAGTVGLAVPLAVRSLRSHRLVERVTLGALATMVGVGGTSVSAPLLLLGTRRGVDAWEAAGASPSRTGLRFATTGAVMAGLGLGSVVAGFRLDKAKVDAGEPLAAVGMALLGVGLGVATAGTLMQWTAFPEAAPLMAWTVPLGGGVGRR